MDFKINKVSPKVLGMWSADMAIDLGTANTLVYVKSRGIVLDEVPTRTPTNRRVYTIEQLDVFLGQRREKKMPYRVIAYCRVSSVAQRPDLKNQRRTLEDFCASRGLAGVEFVEEIGGGLNFKRKKFTTIMDAVVRDLS